MALGRSGDEAVELDAESEGDEEGEANVAAAPVAMAPRVGGLPGRVPSGASSSTDGRGVTSE